MPNFAPVVTSSVFGASRTSKAPTRSTSASTASFDARSSSSSSSSLALFDVVVGDIAPRARHRTAVFPTTRSRRLFDARDVVERARVGARALRRVRRRP